MVFKIPHAVIMQRNSGRNFIGSFVFIHDNKTKVLCFSEEWLEECLDGRTTLVSDRTGINTTIPDLGTFLTGSLNDSVFGWVTRNPNKQNGVKRIEINQIAN